MVPIFYFPVRRWIYSILASERRSKFKTSYLLTSKLQKIQGTQKHHRKENVFQQQSIIFFSFHCNLHSLCIFILNEQQWDSKKNSHRMFIDRAALLLKKYSSLNSSSIGSIRAERCSLHFVVWQLCSMWFFSRIVVSNAETLCPLTTSTRIHRMGSVNVQLWLNNFPLEGTELCNSAFIWDAILPCCILILLFLSNRHHSSYPHAVLALLGWINRTFPVSTFLYYHRCHFSTHFIVSWRMSGINLGQIWKQTSASRDQLI